LGQALVDNTVVTYVGLDVCEILTQDETALDSAALLLRFLQTSSALKKVKLEGLLNRPLLHQLGHEIIKAIALNSSVEIVDIGSVHGLLPDPSVLLLTTKTSMTTLTFRILLFVLYIQYTSGRHGAGSESHVTRCDN
jgi:hypothetical protein